MSFVSDGL